MSYANPDPADTLECCGGTVVDCKCGQKESKKPKYKKPEKYSDEWYEEMDNPKSAWRAGE